LRERTDYNYVGDAPESFIVSRDLISPALAALGKGSDDLFESALAELKTVSTAHGSQEVSIGERYWFWNMLASRTLDKLVKDGTLVRRGNGRFKLTSSQ
jgi:hypothetical protein